MPVPLVADDTTATAAQYNALVSEIQSETVGHAHTGETNEGKKVSHTDLTDGTITGLSNSHTHAQIDTHINDDQGQHGLNASAYAVGNLTSTLNGVAGQITIQTGAFPWASMVLDTPNSSYYGDVSFETEFDSAPLIFLTPNTIGYLKTSSPTWYPSVENVTTTGFRIRQSYLFNFVTMHWMAIGKLT